MPDRLLTDGKFRGLFWAFVVIMVAATSISMIALLVLVFGAKESGEAASKQSNDNFEVIKKVESAIEAIDRTNDRILDCTQAPGKCYTEGQQRTADAVTGINEGTFRVIVAALSCQQDGITEEKPLAQCTARRAKSLVIPE